MNIFTTKILSILGVFLAFIVIGLGAWTRLADAGLGCPDWPGCYGFITFPTTSQEIEMAEQLYPDSPVEIDKIIPEVVHRYFAASLGLLAIFLLFISIKEKKTYPYFISIACNNHRPRNIWLSNCELKTTSFNSHHTSFWSNDNYINFSCYFFKVTQTPAQLRNS